MGNPGGGGDGDGDEDSDDDDDSEDGGGNDPGVVPSPRVLPQPGASTMDTAMLNAFSDIASVSRSQVDINRKILSHQKRTAKRKREERLALSNLTEQMRQTMKVVLYPLANHRFEDPIDLNKAKYSKGFEQIIEKSAPNHLYTHIQV